MTSPKLLAASQSTRTEAEVRAKRASHTPGPWVAEPTPSTDFVTRRIYGPNNEKVADVGVPTRSNLDVHTEVANARLIAAAPELLEAGNEILQYVGGWDVTDPDHPIVKFRAAIAKATGQ